MRPALLALLIAALAFAGCGAATGRPASSKHTVVKTRHSSLGTYLVDGKGRTLYRFLKDTGRKSNCTGACAQDWPPVTSREKPEAEGRAKASKLSTKRRKDGGGRQVLYAGHPLYRFAGDGARGDTNGHGLNAFGARWYVVAPSGRTIRASSAGGLPGGY